MNEALDALCEKLNEYFGSQMFVEHIASSMNTDAIHGGRVDFNKYRMLPWNVASGGDSNKIVPFYEGTIKKSGVPPELTPGDEGDAMHIVKFLYEECLNMGIEGHVKVPSSDGPHAMTILSAQFLQGSRSSFTDWCDTNIRNPAKNTWMRTSTPLAFLRCWPL